MGTTLTGTTPQDTYDSLIKVTDNGPLSGTAKYLSDGLGNDSALALSTGNIGIGTNTPDSNLVVNGSASVRVNLRASNVRYGTIYADNGIVALSSITAIPLVLATDDTERMRITSAGNVGIGTSTPSAKLNLVQTASTTNTALKIESSGTLANNDILRVQVNGLTNGFRIFQNASSEVKYTFIDGQMGVGTETPAVPLDVVGNIRSSTGILFGTDTAAANLLDDYEEGTFTPTIAGSTTAGTATYTNRVGVYTKIGRQVSVQIDLGWNSGTGTGSLIVTGLPFADTSNTNPAITIGYLDGITLTASNYALAYIPSLSSTIDIVQTPVGGGSVTSVAYDAAGRFILNVTYTA